MFIYNGYKDESVLRMCSYTKYTWTSQCLGCVHIQSILGQVCAQDVFINKVYNYESVFRMRLHKKTSTHQLSGCVHIHIIKGRISVQDVFIYKIYKDESVLRMCSYTKYTRMYV